MTSMKRITIRLACLCAFAACGLVATPGHAGDWPGGTPAPGRIAAVETFDPTTLGNQVPTPAPSYASYRPGGTPAPGRIAAVETFDPTTLGNQVPTYASYRPNGTPAPEDTIKLLVQSYAAGDVTATRVKYTTPSGRRIFDWLIAQPWFVQKSAPIVVKKSTPTVIERPALVVLERKHEGDRFEIIWQFNGKDGTERVAAIFFFQDGVMKFHDLFLFEVNGDKFDMFLSYVLDSPWLAQADFAWKNPGKSLGAALQAAGEVIRFAGELAQVATVIKATL
jgi:hypothetical protein